ncbi:MAG TPA: hypothetical protein VFG20_02610 [Planctomycetaceae bacterium]|nr:hypothetical protein [Planctomycetaceae bacterium]
MHTFTDQELRAYLAEELSVPRSVELERAIASDEPLRDRLRALLDDSPSALLALRDVWRRSRLSCPSRTVLSDYLAGQLGDGLGQYIQFHLTEVGCRVCAANLADLQEQGGPDAADRGRKFFATSVGRLRHVE